MSQDALLSGNERNINNVNILKWPENAREVRIKDLDRKNSGCGK